MAEVKPVYMTTLQTGTRGNNENPDRKEMQTEQGNSDDFKAVFDSQLARLRKGGSRGKNKSISDVDTRLYVSAVQHIKADTPD